MNKVKLGDIAREVRDTVKNAVDLPSVGLEHLMPGDLSLNHWSESDENTFTRLFHKGQVLFGRRRAYLKKAVVAPFDGVCSGDITVIAAKPDKVLPELLPFIISDDRFFDYAMEKSAGSLSPRVKWAQLAEYPLELPAPEEQKGLAELLWSMERAKKAYQNLLVQTDELVKSQFIEMFTGKGYSEMLLSEVCKKITDGTHKTPKYQDQGITFISAKNIVDGQLDFTDIKHISDTEYLEIQKRCQTEQGDVLLAKSGSLGMAAIIETAEPLGLFESLAVLKYDRTLLNGVFLCRQIQSDMVQRQLMSNVKGVAVKHLHLNVIASTKIIVPPLALQECFCAFAQQADKSKFCIQFAEKILNVAIKVTICTGNMLQ